MIHNIKNKIKNNKAGRVFVFSRGERFSLKIIKVPFIPLVVEA
jgi:hypothetical protein